VCSGSLQKDAPDARRELVMLGRQERVCIPGERSRAAVRAALGYKEAEEATMWQISSEAQALIDRLATLDFTNPHCDQTAVENAMSRHLKELGEPLRPFRWFPDGRSAHQYVRDTRWDSDWCIASALVTDAAHIAAGRAELGAAHEGARHLAKDAAQAAAAHDAFQEVRSAVWDAVWTSSSDIRWTPARVSVREAVEAIAELNALSIFDHPTQTKLVRVSLPWVDAFAAGVLMFWILPRQVLCVPRPDLPRLPRWL
jgi:hypothetical protein